MEYLQAHRSNTAAAIDIESLAPVEPVRVEPVRVEPTGVWINDTNGQTRLALTRDGTYSKTQGIRQSTYSGRYSCQGTRIRFVDDFDFVLTGEISGNILRIGAYTYRRA